MHRGAWLLCSVLAWVTAACSGDRGNPPPNGSITGGGYGGGGGISGGIPKGPLLDCEPGDLDLSSTQSPGWSLQPLAPVSLSTPTQIAGQNGYESGEIGVCVPKDTVSLVLYGGFDQEIWASSYVASGLGEVVDTSSLYTLVRFQTPELMLPKGPEIELHPGRHTFKLAGQFAGETTPQLVVRRGARAAQSQFGINLILVDGSGIDSTNAKAWADASVYLETIYANAGIALTAVGVGAIHDSSLAVLSQADEMKLTQAFVEASPEAPLLDGGINFYFVRELTSTDTVGQLLGHALGIPGIPSIPEKAGIVLSVDGHRLGGAIDFKAMWITAAHEGGHWHGLRHTSERWGTVHDLLGDTPECPASRDKNHDGLVDPFECSGSGAQNLMFWIYSLSKPPTQLSAGQAWVLASAPTMVPM